MLQPAGQLWGWPIQPQAGGTFFCPPRGSLQKEISEKLRLQLTGEREGSGLTKTLHRGLRSVSALSEGDATTGTNGAQKAVQKAVEYFQQALDRDPAYFAGLRRLG